MDELEDRIAELARAAGAAADRPGFIVLLGRARRRRRNRTAAGLGAVCLAIGVSVTVSTVAGGGAALLPADRLPGPSASAASTSRPAPLQASRGVVGQVVILPSGAMVVVYDRCASGTAICLPRAYSRPSARSSWAPVPLPAASNDESVRVAVTTAGEPVLMHGTGSVFSTDSTRTWRSPRVVRRPRPADLSPAHAVLVAADVGVAAGNVGVNALLDLRSGVVYPFAVPTEDLAAPSHASDGRPGLVVETETSDQTGYLSRDLGLSWLPLPPEPPGTAFRTGVLWQGSSLTRLAMADIGVGKAFAYVLRSIETSVDNGRTWRTLPVATEPRVRADSVTALPGGGFLGADLRGRLLEAGTDGVFRPSPAPPGRITATGASSSSTWVVVDDAKVWQRTASAWEQLSLPEG